ncbi:MAG TPA: hypothetical protein VGK01_17010 [Candidatus Angelobacter sp.]|jgi:hypothetical protein
MNLPNGWGNLVTVLAQENQLFAGCNGLVYRMDLVKGAPFMQLLNLPGMGDGAEVRLCHGGRHFVRGSEFHRAWPYYQVVRRDVFACNGMLFG